MKIKTKIIVLIIVVILVICLAYINRICNPENSNVTKNKYCNIEDDNINQNEIFNNIVVNNNEIEKISIDESKLNIFYFYVGQADCTLIINNKETMLIDAGDNTDGELIVQFLNSIEVKQIDYLIATHSDDDHIGGMADIIRKFPILNLYIPNREATNKAYEELVKATNNEEKVKLQNVHINQTGSIRRSKLDCKVGR